MMSDTVFECTEADEEFRDRDHIVVVDISH